MTKLSISKIDTAKPEKLKSVGSAAGRQEYIAICGKRIEEQATAAEITAARMRRRLSSCTPEVFKIWRREAFAQEQSADKLSRKVAENDQEEMGAKNKRRDSTLAKLQAEFAALRGTPNVESISVVNNTVIVRTPTLKAIDPKTGAQHEIGKFNIVIDLGGKNYAVHWFNIDRRVDGYKKAMNAPYVFADGSACLSEITQSMLELTARLELAVVVDLATQFIENVGNDELGSYITAWPVQSTNEKEKT
jgi:hypothetical protein